MFLKVLFFKIRDLVPCRQKNVYGGPIDIDDTDRESQGH